MDRLIRPAGWGASRTLDATAHSTVLTWKGRSSGCLDRTSAAIPAMWGAAYEFPVPRIQPPPIQGTSTSIPLARNSVGGSGLYWNRNGSVDRLQATLVTDAYSDGKLGRTML